MIKYYKPEKFKDIENIIIYRNNDEFCSWPFNAGMWKISENNILTAFMNISCDYSLEPNLNHDRVETFGRIAAVRSPDGGQNWGQASLIPACKIPRFQGRPSYIVRPDGVILLFLTARPDNNKYDRPVVYASFDNGCNWCLMSLMPGSNEYRMICPSPVLMENGRIIVAVRCKPSIEGAWDELYGSEDGGRTWRFISRINDHGDTVHLNKLEDGRLVCVYGYRRPPYGIRARVSEDKGSTWGPELILRDDGGSWDIGYPRTVEIKEGQILAAYYFNDREDAIQMHGGVRYIAGSIFEVL